MPSSLPYGFTPINDDPDMLYFDSSIDPVYHRGRGRSQSVASLVRSRPGSPTLSSTPNPTGSQDPYFYCEICFIPRAIHRRVQEVYFEKCYYCDEACEEYDVDNANQMRWCLKCHQEKSRNVFYEDAEYVDGQREHKYCLDCRYVMDLSPVAASRRQRHVSPRRGQNPGQAERRRQGNQARMNNPDPPINTTSFSWLG